MANKVTETNTLTVELEYNHTDEETGKEGTKKAYLRLPNFKSNLTENEIKTAVLKVIGTPQILKNTYGAPFDTETAIASAYTEYQKKTEIDIGVN